MYNIYIQSGSRRFHTEDGALSAGTSVGWNAGVCTVPTRERGLAVKGIWVETDDDGGQLLRPATPRHTVSSNVDGSQDGIRAEWLAVLDGLHPTSMRRGRGTCSPPTRHL